MSEFGVKTHSFWSAHDLIFLIFGMQVGFVDRSLCAENYNPVGPSTVSNNPFSTRKPSGQDVRTHTHEKSILPLICFAAVNLARCSLFTLTCFPGCLVVAAPAAPPIIILNYRPLRAKLNVFFSVTPGTQL